MLGFLGVVSDQAREQDLGCRTRPLLCLAQTAVNAAVIVSAWWALSYMAGDDRMPSARGTALFVTGYFALSWLTRALNLEFQDKFNVAAGFQLGYRLFGLLSGIPVK